MTTPSELPNEKITCARHGESYATFVCQHLVQGRGLGFFHGGEDVLRPDAWCAACDRFLTAHGGVWNDETEPFAQIKVICAQCYDDIRQRNALPAG